MATLRKRNGKWQVQVRSAGHSTSGTFLSKANAVAWGRAQELAIETNGFRRRINKALTVGDILDRYEREVIPLKRSDSTEGYMLRVIRRYPVAQRTLSTVCAEDIAEFRDQRLKEAKPSTVLRQMRVLRHALKIAVQEWDLPVPLETLSRVRLPKVTSTAVSRVSDSTIAPLIEASNRQANPSLSTAIRLALATGMRRGEILALKW